MPGNRVFARCMPGNRVFARCMSGLISFARVYKSCEEHENSKIKNSCPQWDLNPVFSACEETVPTIALPSLISIERVKNLRAIYLCYF